MIPKSNLGFVFAALASQMDIPITQAKTTGQMLQRLLFVLAYQFIESKNPLWERKTNIFEGHGLGIVPHTQIRKYKYTFMVGN